MTAIDLSEREGSTRVALQIKRWLVGALGMGFLGLAVDVFLEHYISRHSQAQWIPIVFGPLAGATALVTAWWFEALSLRLFSMACWISIAVGGLGLYYHGMAVIERLESLQGPWTWQALLGVLRYAPPLGAPGAFMAMGILGLLVHTCALKLEHVLPPTTASDAARRRPMPVVYGLFALAFLAIVLVPLVLALIHRLF